MSVIDELVATNTRHLCLINEQGDAVIDTLYIPNNDVVAPENNASRPKSLRLLKAGMKRAYQDREDASV